MSTATYRGIKYDTTAKQSKPCSAKTVHEIYRGIKHDEKLRVSQ